MLGDPTACLAKDFEVYIDEVGLSERGTFIVDPAGKIVSYEVLQGSVGRSAKELLRRVQACQFVASQANEVCPAAWTPGSDTLTPNIDLIGKL